MKAALEQIPFKHTNQSFHFFKQSNTIFLPFWHYHPEIELTLITKGSGTRFVGNSIRSFTDYDLVLLGENLPHHWVSTSKEKNQEAYIIQFNRSMFACLKEHIILDDLFTKARRGIQFKEPDGSIIQKIVGLESLSALSKLSVLFEILEALLIKQDKVLLTSEDYSNRLHKGASQTKIAQTTNYILEHLQEPLSVGRMADLTHMVPQSFCRWFKKHSGHSFISFLNQTRVEQVCHLLISTNDTIQDIAFSCGFESLSHFNRTFKHLKKFSPREFRKLNSHLN